MRHQRFVGGLEEEHDFFWGVPLFFFVGAFVRVLEEDPTDTDAKLALVELGREMTGGQGQKSSS